MEVRRVAEALLRRPTPQLASLLTPGNTVRTSPRTQLSYKRSSNASFRRNISNTSTKNALKQSVTTSAQPTEDPKAEESSSTASESKPTLISIFSPSSNTSAPKDSSLDGISASLGWATPKARPVSPSKPILFPSRSDPSTQRTTAGDILSSISQRGPSYNQTRTPMDVNKMLGISNPGSRSGQPTSLADTLSSLPTLKAPPRPLINLNPSTGRSVMVGRGSRMDLATGIMMVNISCQRNAVKRDARRQERHERPGLKRKRLTRMRYRKRFMEGFKATCKKVKEMSRMGW